MIVNKCKTAGELEKQLERLLGTCSKMASGCSGMNETFHAYADRAAAYGDILKQVKEGKSLKEIAEYAKGRIEFIDRWITGFTSEGMGRDFRACAAKGAAYQGILDCIKK